MPLTSYTGILTPADLKVVQKVFDQLCEERRLAQKDRDQREELAAEVVRVFQQGITSEADLRRFVSKRRKGQNQAEMPEQRLEPSRPTHPAPQFQGSVSGSRSQSTSKS